MNCPECGKDLGEGTYIGVNEIGWVCSHATYDIKIYKVGRDSFD